MKVEAALSTTSKLTFVTDSGPLELEIKKDTVGEGSLSKIVAIWIFCSSGDALVGDPIVAMIVSSGSSKLSSTKVMVMGVPSFPAVMVTGLSVMV